MIKKLTKGGRFHAGRDAQGTAGKTGAGQPAAQKQLLALRVCTLVLLALVAVFGYLAGQVGGWKAGSNSLRRWRRSWTWRS